MKKLLTGAIAVAALTLVSGCNDSFDPSSDCQGFISLDLSVDSSVLAPQSRSRAGADLSYVTSDNLQVRLTGKSFDYVGSWASASEFTGGEFPVGDYTLEAFYGAENDQEGFDKPYFYGSEDLTVMEGKTTSVSLTATLANAMLTVKFTDAVKQYFADYLATVTTSKAASFDVAGRSLADGAPLFVAADGEIRVNVTVTKPNGTNGTLNAYAFTPEARHHYYLTFDVNNGEVGAVDGLILTFNSDMVEESVDVDLTDQVLVSPKPAITASGFTPGTPIQVIAGSVYTDPLRATILAEAGVKGVTLTTTSKSLIAKGWPATVDLVAADDATVQLLESLGLKTAGLRGATTQMATVNFEDVISHITYIDGGDNNAIFQLVATDKYNKVSDPLALTLNLDPVDMSFGQFQPYHVGDTQVKFAFNFNAGDPSHLVSFEMLNTLGRWEKITPVSIVESPALGAGHYDVTINIPAGMATVNLHAIFGEKVIDGVGNPLNLMVAVDNNDVFATNATLSLYSLDGADTSAELAQASIHITDATGVTVAKNGSKFSLKGLKPDKTYTAYVVTSEGESNKVDFTTEQAIQLPNAGMEDWYIAAQGSSSAYNWKNYAVAAEGATQYWGTNNPMTTREGADGSGQVARATSTLPTSDAHSGSNAAVVRTVAWGSGNTAPGLTLGWNVVTLKYCDPGLLHLGASRSARPAGYSDFKGVISTADLDCGLAFVSRPAALSFWYKYSPKWSADLGLAEVAVYAADNSLIASGTTNLASQQSYTKVNVPLTYAPGAKKAAKIYVKFLSCSTADYMVKSADYFTAPGRADYSTSFVGSVLYIDDVELVY